MLNTDPDAVAIAELMQAIFGVFVETVLKNPFVDISKRCFELYLLLSLGNHHNISLNLRIDSELFHKRVDELVRAHYCFT